MESHGIPKSCGAHRPPGGPCGWQVVGAPELPWQRCWVPCGVRSSGAWRGTAGSSCRWSRSRSFLSETEWNLKSFICNAWYNMYKSSVRSLPNDLAYLALCCPHKSRRFQWASSLAASVVGSQGKASRSLTDVIRCKSCLIWVTFYNQHSPPYLRYLTYQHIQFRVNFLTQHNCIQPRIVPRFRRSSCGELQTRCWALLDFRGPPSGALGFWEHLLDSLLKNAEPWEKRSPGRRVTEIAGEAQALGGADEKKWYIWYDLIWFQVVFANCWSNDVKLICPKIPDGQKQHI